MSQKEYRAWMREAGWTIVNMDGGPVFTIDLDDRTLISFGGFSKATDCFIFEDGGSVGFPWHKKIIKEISPKMGENIWLVDRHNSRFKTPGRGSAGFIIECTDELIKWAKSIDPHEEIRKLAAHDKVYEGYNHLAALALTGDIDQLNYYLKFRKTEPDDAPFVPGTLRPAIKKEHIERAIELAKRFQKEPIDWPAPKEV